MKRNYRTREQVAMKLELESYRGNQALKRVYIKLLNSQEGIDCSFIDKDLKRIKGNMLYLEKRLEKLPKQERDFLFDVYFGVNNEISEIMKKYGLKRSSYHRYLDKVIFAFAQLKE